MTAISVYFSVSRNFNCVLRKKCDPMPEGIHKHQFAAIPVVALPIINLAKHERHDFSSFRFPRGICQCNWNILRLTCIISVLTRSMVAPLMSARGASLVAKKGVSLSKTIFLDIKFLGARK